MIGGMDKLKRFYAAALAFFGLGAVVEINQIFDEQMPACKVSAPDRVTVQSCRDKEPMQVHASDDMNPTYRPTVGVTITPATGRIVSTMQQFIENPAPAFIKPQTGSRIVTDSV
jgi:hypothetical protein